MKESLFSKKSKIKFLGKPVSKINNVNFLQTTKPVLKPSPYFRKENINQRRLNPFGDADMDGTLNKFDCNPRRADKDGFFNDAFTSVKKAFSSPQQKYDDKVKELRAKSTQNMRLDTQLKQKRLEELRNDNKVSQIKKERASLRYQKALNKLSRVELSNQKRETITEPAVRDKRIKRYIENAGSMVLPDNVKQDLNLKTRTGKRGRPQGTIESKYARWGGVMNYRKWRTEQLKLAALRGQQKMPFKRTLSDDEQVPVEGSYSQQVQSSEAEPAYQQKQVQVTPELLQRAAQLQAQINDNILNAPNFMKGQLKNVGNERSMTYTSPEQNILNAPNFNQGQLRTLDNRKEIPAVKVSAPPMANPDGDEYIEVDAISGKQFVVKRPREKWLYQGDEFGFADKYNTANRTYKPSTLPNRNGMKPHEVDVAYANNIEDGGAL